MFVSVPRVRGGGVAAIPRTRAPHCRRLPAALRRHQPCYLLLPRCTAGPGTQSEKSTVALLQNIKASALLLKAKTVFQTEVQIAISRGLSSIPILVLSNKTDLVIPKHNNKTSESARLRYKPKTHIKKIFIFSLSEWRRRTRSDISQIGSQ